MNFHIYQYIHFLFYLCFLNEAFLLFTYSIDSTTSSQTHSMGRARVFRLRHNIGSLPICLEFHNSFFDRVLKELSKDQGPNPKGMWPDFPIVMGNSSLQIGRQDPQQFIYPPSYGFFQHFLYCGEQGLVHCFCLPVALRVVWSKEQIFYFEFRTKGSKSNVVELWSIISYDRLRDPELTNDVFPNKPRDVFVFDIGISFSFYPLAEIVSGHKKKFFLSGNNGQGANYVHSPLANSQGLVTGLRTSKGI